MDNDCDGESDEDLAEMAPLAARQLGICAGVRQTCGGQAGWLAPDYGADIRYEPQESLCDGADNDCDGTVDESCPDCGNGIIEADEECDHERVHCVDCRVRPVDVSDGGEFPSGFNAGGFDLFDFTLDGPYRVTLWTQAGGCDCGGDAECVPIDPALALSSGQQLIVSDNDGGDGRCPRVVLELDAGQYRVLLNSNVDAHIPAYTFHATFVSLLPNETCNRDGVRNGPEECDEPPPDCLDCRVQAVTMPRSGAYPGSIQAGSFDRFRFHLAEAGNVRLETRGLGGGPCPGDTTLGVYPIADDGEREIAPLAFDNDGGLLVCSRIDRPYPAGGYEVIVQGLGRAPVPPYELSAEIAGQPPNDD